MFKGLANADLHQNALFMHSAYLLADLRRSGLSVNLFYIADIDGMGGKDESMANL